jgi:hypothetical protein
MSVGNYLVNASRREAIYFNNVDASTRAEIAGSPAAAAIVAWYMLTHQGDQISFVSDANSDWPFARGSRDDLRNYPDVTPTVIAQLLAAGILAEDAPLIIDSEKPAVFVRRLRNVWSEDSE